MKIPTDLPKGAWEANGKLSPPEVLDIAWLPFWQNSHGKKVRSNPMKSLGFPFGSPSIYKEGNGKVWEANKNRYDGGRKWGRW